MAIFEFVKIIGSKAELKKLAAPLLCSYDQVTFTEFTDSLHKVILKKKIRFPILESFTHELYSIVPSNKQIKLLNAVSNLHEIGGNVILGKLLQFRLETKFEESFEKASEYIIKGNQWYVCDIIGERVMGHALLTEAEKTIPQLIRLTKHQNAWLVRSVGVAIHYAVKKGLKKIYVERAFQILLGCSDTTDFHTKKGIGWAAKTIAKFHPEVISKYKPEIDNDPHIKQWFKTKIKIGFGRSFKYATKYTS